MTARLSRPEASMLAQDGPDTTAHVGMVHVLGDGSGRLDHDGLLDLVGDLLAYVPRYRQRVRSVPGQLTGPLWVDDAGFDLRFHVRRAALPSTGSSDRLHELVAELMSTPLDRSRPL